MQWFDEARFRIWIDLTIDYCDDWNTVVAIDFEEKPVCGHLEISSGMRNIDGNLDTAQYRRIYCMDW